MADIAEIFKTSLLALFVGILPAIAFQYVAAMLAGWGFVMYFLYGLVLVWAIPKLPRNTDTFFDFLVLTFMLLGLSGLIGMFFSVSWLQWANIGSVMGFLTTLTVAIVALAIREEYLPI